MNYALLPSPSAASGFSGCLWLLLASGQIFLAQQSDYQSFCAAVAKIGGEALPAAYDSTAVAASILSTLAPIRPPANATTLQVAQAAALLNPGFAPN